MGKLQQFTMTRVGWTSLVALGVVRALELRKTREIDREVLVRDFLVEMPDVPATTLPRLIREVLSIVEQYDAKNG